jgi:hypothetical protein
MLTAQMQCAEQPRNWPAEMAICQTIHFCLYLKFYRAIKIVEPLELRGFCSLPLFILVDTKTPPEDFRKIFVKLSETA